MIEARRSETSAQLVGETFVLAEHNPGQDRAPLALEAWSHRAREPRPQAVGEARETTPPADDPPPRCPQHDVHAVTTQPRALVKAVLRAVRELDLADYVEKSALRRRAAQRKTEEHRLSDDLVSELAHLRRHAQLIA